MDSNEAESPVTLETGIKPRNTANVRSSRESKNKAIAAMKRPSGEEVVIIEKEQRKNPIKKKGIVATRLDFSTIKTSAPRNASGPPARPPSQPDRMFGLQHAPVYHPSIEEFAQPMEYIEKIGLEARQFGICKIVPPVGWRPPFALNTETFRFKTRLQDLNSMEASARASLNFLEQLYIYHRQQGSKDIDVPLIAGKPLDLWKLRKEVDAVGGYIKVCADRAWVSISQSMGFDTHSHSTIPAQIKSAYLTIVVPFEHYVQRVKKNGGPVPPDPAIIIDSRPATPLFPSTSHAKATPISQIPGMASRMDIDATEKVRTASDKLNQVLGTSQGAGLSPASKALLKELPGDSCEICTMEHDPEMIVLCDVCDRGYHLACLTPALLEVPKSQFYCEACLLMNGADYGFEEGEEHSLHSFRKKADAFKKDWLINHPLPLDKGKGKMAQNGSDGSEKPSPMVEAVAMEDHIEREFWRCVESQHESVEVEYGADVNYTKEGGGLPNLENHPSNPYSRDGWNLNNLPILAGSLLRYIKSDISGMTIPWIYVGMIFSTFAWHKEDHYTYSINYHHFGETKTWYGIPGADDEKLESAMKLAAPELFEQQPDLLFQLVTLMSPGRLQKHGCRVVACDQRPNEFVITFPRSYHSGFNHGFNFNEAVNFALPDWLPTGLKCVNRYRDIKKNPVFSHDELLVTISQHEKTPKNARWLLPNWKEMLDRELSGRDAIRKAVPGLKEIIDESEIEEEEYQCGFCKTLAYLSQLKTIDHPAVACLDHVSSLPPGPKSLRLRYSDAEFKGMFSRVKARSDKWDPSIDTRTTEPRKRKQSTLAAAAAEENNGSTSESSEDQRKSKRGGKRAKLVPKPPPGAAHSDDSTSSAGEEDSNEDQTW